MSGVELPGLRIESVSAWLEANAQATPPFTFTLIAGGRSNLTFRVDDAFGRRFVLRRPPQSHVLQSAHDMVREFTVTFALHPTRVPVARPVALCTDGAVNGSPFYVMEFVEGAILRTKSDAVAAFDETTRYTLGRHLTEALVELHDVNVASVGLSDFARHGGYIERQVRRWRTQYDQTVMRGAPAISLIAEVGDRLLDAVPTQQIVSVVHGDYRIDNTVLAPDGRVAAILDWEICTLGDPLADLGTLLCYWAEPGDAVAEVLGEPPTLAPGFMTRNEVIRAYAEHSMLDLSQVDFYLAFAYWRLACIAQGVFARYQAGARAGDPSSVAAMPGHVASLASAAHHILLSP